MKETNKLYTVALVAALVCLAVVLGMLAMGYRTEVGPFCILFFILLAIGVRKFPAIKGFSYTISIFAAVTVAMFYPAYFVELNGFQLKTLIVPLLQIIMFGMGTAMSLNDFAGVIKMPKAVMVGLICQFSIMPGIGFILANVFDFPPEIAAGIILIGSAPSGLASNVMSYLANANLALSVTITAIATLLAPVMTPLLMKLLAGEFVAVDVWAMMWDIVKMVIIPIGAGLLFNKLLSGKAKWLDDAMPLVSMIGIAFIITIITAAGRDSLLAIGLVLILVAFIHNTCGYLLGYWFSRLVGLDERSCRTVAIEVGMQNGGLASAIALQMGKVATVGLAPAIFGPLMNITGSSLATWWRGKPIKEEVDEKKDVVKEKKITT
ncbi:bile acid:sodium symporter family protein [Rhodocytophaga aerolata]|uniref:Bile acid:sodium symporter family protein n=1 Tax=Rhodocytophaga aerolata TaxID=455078 RepID=A0ABT8R0B8_9BACT|nr:bile acid:sodium symporter family protein [Rhodocytophaga aerolata]MDO1444703.1 bile acid:sodium symporter family protein [Rhodocytophaga aerolata]